MIFTVTFRFLLGACEMTHIFVRNEKYEAIIILKVLATMLQTLFFLQQGAQDLCSPVFNCCVFKLLSMASNCLMVVENVLESTWKEAVMDVC